MTMIIAVLVYTNRGLVNTKAWWAAKRWGSTCRDGCGPAPGLVGAPPQTSVLLPNSCLMGGRLVLQADITSINVPLCSEQSVGPGRCLACRTKFWNNQLFSNGQHPITQAPPYLRYCT
jgi:hypothetical protein